MVNSDHSTQSAAWRTCRVQHHAAPGGGYWLPLAASSRLGGGSTAIAPMQRHPVAVRTAVHLRPLHSRQD